MPKKLPFYWPDDSNCNKLRSKTLRVLRDRPSKLNSERRPVPSLCEQFKNKPIKTEKTEKLRPIEDFHGFISAETLLSRHSKNRTKPRQILHSNKNQRTEALRLLNLNSNWKKKYSNSMAVDFDHMYLDCGDSKISIGREIEFQHLKELNLLHLDLIQQQSEQLISKDKIIKTLTEENKNLRARLERIDRRVSLSHQKKNALSPISVQTDFSDDLSFPVCAKSDSPKTGQKHSSAKSPAVTKGILDKSPVKVVKEETLLQTENLISKRDSLRKHSPKQISSNSSLSPVSQVLRVSPREKRAKKDTPSISDVPLTEITSATTTTTTTTTTTYSVSTTTCNIPPSVSPSCDKKLRSLTIKRTNNEESITPSKKNKNLEMEEKDKSSTYVEEEGITNHSLRSRNKSSEEIIQNHSPNLKTSESTVPILPQAVSDSSEGKPEKPIPEFGSNYDSSENEKLKHSTITMRGISEVRKIRGEGILTTDESYYLPPPSSIDYLESSADEEQTQVEIPQWRIKILTSLYVMEGTENLEDEVFIKRHAKPEQDERRRKRWDLQRMREQRQYEKLRERYEGRNNIRGSHGGYYHSLWPNPETAQAIQIDNYLPVCAFGQPLAQISESDFSVPWLSCKMPLQVTRRKKR